MMNFKSVRTSYTSKIVISFLTIQLIVGGIFPTVAFAAPEGPTQPEFNSFTPIGVSDMVDLTSGDFSYSIPIIDVGGYPMSLGYSSATNFDSPSSWVGHGWDLSAGQINRSMRVIPDDFDGTDKIKTENSKKPNKTYVLGMNGIISLGGFDLAAGKGEEADPKVPGAQLNVGLAMQYNNYTGMSINTSFGPSFSIHKKFNTGINFTPSTTNGVGIQPTFSAISKESDPFGIVTSTREIGVGVALNSFSGFQSVNLNGSASTTFDLTQFGIPINDTKSSRLGSGTLSFQPSMFSPSYDLGFRNISGKVNVAGGFTAFGGDLKFEVYANYAEQKLKPSYKNKYHKAYGYNYSHLGFDEGMRDFSRAFDRPFSPGLATLPVPQNTYDYYNISGQGIQGSFKPQNSQVGYVYDPQVSNTTGDVNIPIEIASGNAIKLGGDITGSFSQSQSGYWKDHKGNEAHNGLNAINSDNQKPNFSRTYFKMIGENTIRNEKDNPNSYVSKLGDKEPIYFGRNGLEKIRGTAYKVGSDQFVNSGANISTTQNGDDGIVQKDRVPTGKSIVPVSIKELKEHDLALQAGRAYQIAQPNYDPSNDINYSSLNRIFIDPTAKDHHQAGFRITDNSGVVYNYDQALYTLSSSNTSFSIEGNGLTQGESQVKYQPTDATSSNAKGTDHFFSKKTIPAYVHTSLLRNIESPDYRDLLGDGASPDDLGSYTLFKYQKMGSTNFRMPVQRGEANYNEGLHSLRGDDKAFYSYGTKEQAFLQRIITKTHVAYFELNDDTNSNEHRLDNLGAEDQDEYGGTVEASEGSSRYLKKIYLYTLKQAEEIGLLDADISNFDANNVSHRPLKTVYFEYDYSLQAAPNGDNLPNSTIGNGKLTLKKVYFTYGKSQMGKLTPYEFQYNNDSDFSFHNLNKDVWGNYKPEGSNDNGLNNREFPYTDQDEELGLNNNKKPADEYIEKFLLSNIKLPSGGQIEIQYEADDYAYVQDQKAMKMYQIAGLGNQRTPAIYNTGFAETYNASGPMQYMYLKLDDGLDTSNKVEDFETRYLDDLKEEPLFFRTHMNINPNNPVQFNEFISGYVYLNNDQSITDNNFAIINNEHYVSIQVQEPKLNGGSGSSVHPFAKATWNYARNYLNTIAFNGTDTSYNNPDLDEVVWDMVRDMGAMLTIFRGPNKELRNGGSGKRLSTDKSFLRLRDASGFKIGGGARVTQISIDSNWDLMTDTSNSNPINYYGQIYDYKAEDGLSSSGVATFEPELSDENPLMLPFEDRNRRLNNIGNNKQLIDKFLAPVSLNYLNGPLMKDYYPNPKVTYGRVAVKNIKPDYPYQNQSQLKITNRASGYVVNEFYTSKDFPTIEKNSIIDADTFDENNVKDFIQGLIGFPANVYSKERFIASQGFYVETNDMDGKSKSQAVFAENATSQNYISKTEYEYQTDDDGNLDNYVSFIAKNGVVTEEEVGVDYDVVNDFRFSDATTFNGGLDANGALFFVVFPVFIGVGIPNVSLHSTQTRSAATAKHVHRGAILSKTTVYESGSSISTENVAYDYFSRQPLLKKVNNEFNDVIYNLDYPAYWVHDEMANASINDGMIFNTIAQGDRFEFVNGANNGTSDLIDYDNGLPYLNNGDELKGNSALEHYWVDFIDYSTSTFDLIDKDGIGITPQTSNEFKVVKSAFDNKQGQVISSVSLSQNPIISDGNTGLMLADIDESFKIYNASAIEMSNIWTPDCECGYFKLNEDADGNLDYYSTDSQINPYFHNIVGHYRPKKSFAYLTGRETLNTGSVSLRNDGFYNDFSTYYSLVNDNDPSTIDKWLAQNVQDWTYASEVSKISPYGLELENKDPLQKPRYSSAMYGFNKKFPTAVASNTEYRELAFDGFEDYDYIEHLGEEHFDFTNTVYQNLSSNGKFVDAGVVDYRLHITNSQSHTGNNSFKLSSNQYVGLEKQLKPCPTQDVGELFTNLLEMLWNNRDLYIDQEGCPEGIEDTPEFLALKPYIYQPDPEVEPSICDIYFNEDLQGGSAGSLSFNFYHNPNANPNGSDRHVNQSNGLVSSITETICDFVIASNYSNEFLTNFYEYSVNHQCGTSGEYLSNDNYVSYINFETYDCIDCTSFSPLSGESYVVSAWVKHDLSSINTSTPQGLRDSQPITYEDNQLTIAYIDLNGNQISSNADLKFTSSGTIINGWQKVYGRFNVIDEAYSIKIILGNKSSETIFYDDIRIHPINGSMKSFVYDATNFRLASELDDNNYATFYEYDLEGNLIRIKKETVRGVMTIQESRQGMTKMAQ